MARCEAFSYSLIVQLQILGALPHHLLNTTFSLKSAGSGEVTCFTFEYHVADNAGLRIINLVFYLETPTNFYRSKAKHPKRPKYAQSVSPGLQISLALYL
jgi:hypothetical protein